MRRFRQEERIAIKKSLELDDVEKTRGRKARGRLTLGGGGGVTTARRRATKVLRRGHKGGSEENQGGLGASTTNYGKDVSIEGRNIFEPSLGTTLVRTVFRGDEDKQEHTGKKRGAEAVRRRERRKMQEMSQKGFGQDVATAAQHGDESSPPLTVDEVAFPISKRCGWLRENAHERPETYRRGHRRGF